MISISRRTSSRRGSVIAEFTLVAPLLILLFIGVVLFGYDFYSYNQLEEVVRTGARFASIQTYDVLHVADPALVCSGGGTDCTIALTQGSSAFARRVANFTVYGTPVPADSDKPLVSGLTAANIQVKIDVHNNAPAYVWVATTGYTLPGPSGTVTLNGKPATVFPYMGTYKVLP